MAYSLNKVMLIGNLGRDAEHRFTPSNVAVTSFSIATSRGIKNKDGSWTNETTWVNIVAFNLNDFIKDALRRGKKFYVEGRLSIREYTDKEGVKKYFTEVVAEKLIPLEAKDSSGEDRSSHSSGPDDYQQANIDSSPEGDLPF